MERSITPRARAVLSALLLLLPAAAPAAVASRWEVTVAVRITGGTFGVGGVGPLVAVAERWVNPMPVGGSDAAGVPAGQ